MKGSCVPSERAARLHADILSTLVLDTVNRQIFASVIFSRIAPLDIFAETNFREWLDDFPPKISVNIFLMTQVSHRILHESKPIIKVNLLSTIRG